ncbi:MAG: RNA polymerase sigma factor [Solirubrobacteraceae bacterium]
MALSEPPSTADPATAEGFGELFEAHARPIYNFCFRRTADWSVAEDLTSAVFLEAWRRRADVDLTSEPALPWLYGVATNLLRNQRRALRRHRAAVDRMAPPSATPDFADDLAARLDDERRMRDVLVQMAHLSVGEQDVLVLCAWQGLSYEDAARALAVPVGTIRSRLSRARSRLDVTEGANP